LIEPVVELIFEVERFGCAVDGAYSIISQTCQHALLLEHR
jgi:hypothetical protein